MTLQQRRKALPFVLVWLVAVFMGYGCALRTPVPTQPVPKTPLQWTIVLNGALARANRTLESSVETLSASGTLSTAQARPVITACGKVATVSESIRAITSRGTEATWTADAAAIRSILSTAGVTLSPTANSVVDAGIAALNASLVLLTQGVQ